MKNITVKKNSHFFKKPGTKAEYPINLHIQNTQKDSLLSLLCEKNDLKNIALLLQPKMQIDPNQKDRYGNTPLYCAVLSNNTKLVKLLLQSDKINPNISRFKRPLVEDAIKNSNPNIILALINHPKTNTQVKNLFGRNMLELLFERTENQKYNKALFLKAFKTLIERTTPNQRQNFLQLAKEKL